MLNSSHRLMMGVVLLAVVTALLPACARKADLNVTVRFQNAADLRVGDDVRIDDLRVGEVQATTESDGLWDVAIVIHGNFRDRVTEDSEFRLKKEGAGGSRRYVALKPGSGNKLADNSVMAGKEPFLSGVTDWARETADRLQSPELREKWSDFSRAVQQAAEKGVDAWREHKPEVEAKARELLDWVQREAPDWFAQIQSAIESLFEKVEKDLRETDV